MRKKKVIVSISGGIDSAITAWILKQQGYQVEGVFMKNWEEDLNGQYCNSANDLTDAQEFCEKLGIILHTVNFSAEYWDYVFTPFLSGLKKGLTLNPDIICNKKIKFKTFFDFAIEDLDGDYMATGHYVRRSVDNHNKSCLLRGVDRNKDQSYCMYTVGHQKISRCLFPLGNLVKSEVRNLARKLNLNIANKKDSTGICFIGKKNFNQFISQYFFPNPGKIICIKNNYLGTHRGLMYYTIGQRKGLNIESSVNGEPWYVVQKDVLNNNLIVAQGKNNPKLMSSNIIVRDLHWVNRNILTTSLKCSVKIRYHHPDINCLIIPIKNRQIKVILDNPVSAITKGQSAVFYLEEHCLGGGIIENNF